MLSLEACCGVSIHREGSAQEPFLLNVTQAVPVLQAHACPASLQQVTEPLTFLRARHRHIYGSGVKIWKTCTFLSCGLAVAFHLYLRFPACLIGNLLFLSRDICR